MQILESRWGTGRVEGGVANEARNQDRHFDNCIAMQTIISLRHYCIAVYAVVVNTGQYSS